MGDAATTDSCGTATAALSPDGQGNVVVVGLVVVVPRIVLVVLVEIVVVLDVPTTVLVVVLVVVGLELVALESTSNALITTSTINNANTPRVATRERRRMFISLKINTSNLEQGNRARIYDPSRMRFTIARSLFSSSQSSSGKLSLPSFVPVRYETTPETNSSTNDAESARLSPCVKAWYAA